jgi:hypothetical protein
VHHPSDDKMIHIEMHLYIPVKHLDHVADLEEIKIAYTNLLKEPEENMPFERSM